MTLVVCDWTAHHKSRPRIFRGIAQGADLLIGCSEDNWCLNHVLRTGTKAQNETSAGRLESKVQTIGYIVDWGRGET